MKNNNTQSNKALNQLSELFSERKPIIKNSSYYSKLYSIKQTRKNDKNPSMRTIFHKTIQTTLSPKKSLSLNRVFKNKTNSRNLKVRWPKITHPKWPFTKKRTEPLELKQNRILSSKPSNKYHNFNTIKWLSQKYSDSVKEKSIYSLLPNNGKPIIPEYESEFNKRHREMMEYLESFRGPGEREKYVNINPKYFYDDTTFKKILKLKEMFLEFDKKGNNKVIIKEIVNFFKQNNINVDINEIKELFFKNINHKNKKDEAKNLLYLNFYQFMNFALNREQDFRQFMRKIKKKNKIEENNIKLKTISYNNDEKKKNIYIPMNFNLIFDYFINKEKQRNSINIVENVIKEMDKIIQRGNENEKSKIISDETPKKEKKSKKESTKKLFVTSKTLKNNNNIKLFHLRSFHKNNTTSKNSKEQHQFSEKKINQPFNSKSTKKLTSKMRETEKDKDDKLKNINFEKLINEFSRLFGIEDKRNSESELYEEKKRTKSANIGKSLFNRYNNNYINKKLKNNDEKSYTDTMKKEIGINSLKELSSNNFEKYHDLKLALNATKEQIKKMKNVNNLIEDDLRLYNMVDIRGIINQHENYFFKSPKANNKLKLNNVLENYSYNNKTDYNKTLKAQKSNMNRVKRRKLFINKKPLYNFYWGKPQIINIDSDLYNTHKIMPKYDYVPNEFLTNIKNKKNI